MSGSRRTVFLALLAAVVVFVILITRIDRPGEPDTKDSGTNEPEALDGAKKTDEKNDEKNTVQKPKKKNPFLQPGPAILLLNAFDGLKGRIDEDLVFHGKELVKMGDVHSGPPLIDRTEVKRIIWPEGVDPKKYK